MSGRYAAGTISPVVAALHQRKKEMGISGYRLAKLSGLPLRTVQRFLAGSGSPTLSTLETIANALGMKISTEDLH